MLCNEISSYPDKIDEMTFFQDVSLNTIEYMNEYQKLISNGDFFEANKYISNKKGIYGYFDCFFNMIENRIYALQDYIEKKEKINPHINYSELPEMVQVQSGNIWTGGKYTKFMED